MDSYARRIRTIRKQREAGNIFFLKYNGNAPPKVAHNINGCGSLSFRSGFPYLKVRKREIATVAIFPMTISLCIFDLEI
jgi:hypothetical protein